MPRMAEEPQAAKALTQAEGENNKPVYEVGFLIARTVGENGVAATLDKIRASIGDVEIISDGAPQKIQLAYTIEDNFTGKINKNTDAYFGWIKFAIKDEDGENDVSSLQSSLSNLKEILRFIVVKTAREDTMASAARAVWTSDRLEGQTLQKSPKEQERGGEVSDEELDRSIEALVQ
jgi:ribosomal protein S6